MKKILILEDDQLLAQTLQTSLHNSTAQVSVTHTLSEFYEYVERHDVHLCILDRMIGSEDSLEAVEYLSDVFPEMRILFLSKKATARERISGLEAGAHDYLAKPFALAELRLRVRRLLETQSLAPLSGAISLGKVVFYPDQGLIIAEQHKVILRKRETEVLACLARTVGAIVSRKKIVDSLWLGSHTPHSSTVDVYIRRLRQRLGPYSSIIQTRKGFGYRLVPFEREASRNYRTSTSS